MQCPQLSRFSQGNISISSWQWLDEHDPVCHCFYLWYDLNNAASYIAVALSGCLILDLSSCQVYCSTACEKILFQPLFLSGFMSFMDLCRVLEWVHLAINESLDRKSDVNMLTYTILCWLHQHLELIQLAFWCSIYCIRPEAFFKILLLYQDTGVSTAVVCNERGLTYHEPNSGRKFSLIHCDSIHFMLCRAFGKVEPSRL